MEDITTNLFVPTDKDTISVKLQDGFSLPNGVNIEIIELQSDTDMQGQRTATFGDV